MNLSYCLRAAYSPVTNNLVLFVWDSSTYATNWKYHNHDVLWGFYMYGLYYLIAGYDTSIQKPSHLLLE